METKEKLTEIIGNVVVNDKGNRIRDVFHPEFVEKIVDALVSTEAYRSLPKPTEAYRSLPSGSPLRMRCPKSEKMFFFTAKRTIKLT